MLDTLLRIIKNYIFRGSTSFTRRSCQTVLAAHLLSIVRYNTEDGSIAKFVFESRWPVLSERWLAFPHREIDLWANILELL
ncbi:unnamed protein product [Camellia sinensis]